ncbi:thermonuclease family protein [Pelobacter propionicus]|uniref:Nuclease (SNase domain protein) n=1 Tax=Pelobacter propionicus (strain DSM 2379 / NBRC 103807 / OttBd1) TaxID=338966 RepID=A0R845_PELPD|nr:thermonuclease family protein [Pelobacter propionicus]ABL01335.1 nuclease (SNase domain protein) [Pelobacter propionicus DSM 2379]
MRFLGLLSMLFLAVSTSAWAGGPLRTVEGVVTKVSDGDTLQVADRMGTKIKVRMYGIDAPETQKGNKRTGTVSKPGQPYGEESFRALYSLVNGQHVRLDLMDVDQYGRTVSIVWLGRRNINREMVATGNAWAYRQYLDRPHASEFIDAEERARKARLGLWRQGKPQPPWEFRKSLKRPKNSWW